MTIKDVPVVDARQAEELLSIRGRIQRRIDRFAGIRDREIARCNTWFEDKTAPDRDRVKRIDEQLEAFMLAHREATGRKSFSTPAGSVESRTSPRVDWPTDMTYVVKVIADAEPSALRIDKATVTRRLATNDVGIVIYAPSGDVLPGVSIEERTSVTVRTKPLATDLPDWDGDDSEADDVA